jgi:hypothetical protein
VSVWLDFAEMIHGESGELADEVVTLLAGAPFGLSCDAISGRLRRRRAEVLEALRWDPRTERTGQGRGSRWRIAAEIPPGPSWDGSGRKDRAEPAREPAPQKISGRRA